jgi:endonuclease/exonuclease/phosphatase family metal-dependent hydrolase
VSRYPITSATRIPLGRHPAGYTMSAIRALVDAGEHGRWRFDLVHPSPHIPEAERAAAFEPLLARTIEPRVVLGDFNALSDEDPYTHEALVADMLPHVKEPAELATTMLDRQLVARLRASGLRDTMPVDARTHTIPTRLERASTNGAKLRIDYVLVSDGIASSNSRVIQSDAADRASDHYPIVVDLRRS